MIQTSLSKKEASRRDYALHKEGYFRRARKSYSNTFSSREARLRRMLVEAKSRAKSSGLEFDVITEDIHWNDVCPVLGISIEFKTRTGAGGTIGSPSIDRIDNNKGYIKGNVRLISNRANKLKRDMTREECKLLYDNWYEV